MCSNGMKLFHVVCIPHAIVKVSFASVRVPLYSVQWVTTINNERFSATQFMFMESSESIIQLWLHVFRIIENVTWDKVYRAYMFNILKSSQILNRFHPNKHLLIENHRISIDNFIINLIIAGNSCKRSYVVNLFHFILSKRLPNQLGGLCLSISLVIWSCVSVLWYNNYSFKCSERYLTRLWIPIML